MPAAELLGAVMAMCVHQPGSPRFWRTTAQRLLETELGPERFEAAMEAGRSLTPDEVLDQARRLLTRHDRDASAPG